MVPPFLFFGKMKRNLLISFLLSASLSCWCNDGDVFKVTSVEGYEVTYKVLSEKNKTCQVGDGTSSATNFLSITYGSSFDVPSEVKGYKVIKIGNSALNNPRFTAITLPDGLLPLVFGHRGS